AAYSTNSKPSTPMGFSKRSAISHTSQFLERVPATGRRKTGNYKGFRAALIPGEPHTREGKPIYSITWARLLPEDRADLEYLGKKREIQRLLQETHAGRAAGARLEADDALDRLHVTEAPELEVLFDVDELLRHLVGVPVVGPVLVDRPEHGHDTLVG